MPAAKRLKNSREVALKLYRAILHKKMFMPILLGQDQDFAVLAEQDRAFARLLLSIMLRRKGQLEQLVSQLVPNRRGLEKTGILDVLLLGCAQLLYMDVPAYAAVDSTVKLARSEGHPRLHGVVNACMRRLGRERESLTPDDRQCGEANIPHWIWQGWCRAYGEAEAQAIAAAILAVPPLDLSLNAPSPPYDKETWARYWADQLQARILPNGTLRRDETGDIRSLPGFEEGAWWVQDMAAALPARLFGDNLSGQVILDVCAAPGGKTAQLAAAGAQVIALDPSSARLRILQQNMARLGLQAETHCTEMQDFIPTKPADGILLDAPCSATGSIRRHPDILHLKSEKDQAALILQQKQMLDAAVPMLKAGGLLVYSTCSLQPEEGEEQIAAFLSRHKNMRLDPISSKEIGDLTEILNISGEIRATPARLLHTGGVDGFYAARMRKAG